jgi:hypothetical protein
MTRSPERIARFIASAVLLWVLLPAPAGAADDPTDIVSFSRRHFESRGLSRAGLDLLAEKDGRVYAVVTPGEIASLVSRGVPFTIETARFAALSAAPAGSAAGGLNGAFHSSYEVETELRLLADAHPGLARLQEIGTSLEARPILALKISDNPGLDEGEPAVLFLGCHHAREWISVEVPLLLARHLLDGYALDPVVRGLVDRGEIWIVPLVNPDGLEYSIHVYRYWRKNRRANADGTFGVDLNRNYGYQWGYDDAGSSPVPGSGIYRGTAPFSEPETEAVRRLFLSRDFRAVVSFHSFAQLILYPWGYVDLPTDKEAELSALAQAMSSLMAAVRGTVYVPGRASAALYTTNGDTTDWTFAVSGAPSFTIELPPEDTAGGGFFNAEAEIEAIFRENLPAMLYLADQALLPSTGDGVRRRFPGALRRPAPRFALIKRIDRDLPGEINKLW